jgi:hypothetical protein
MAYTIERDTRTSSCAEHGELWSHDQEINADAVASCECFALTNGHDGIVTRRSRGVTTERVFAHVKTRTSADTTSIAMASFELARRFVKE